MASDERDSRADDAVARVLDRDGATIGTAFFISPTVALTCHHVVKARTFHLRLGQDEFEDVSLLDEAVAAALDVAIVEVRNNTAPAHLLLDPYAPRGWEFRSHGFQYANAGVLESYPISGEVQGRTGIRQTEYRLPDVLVATGGPVDHGMSGAPLIAKDQQAAFAIVNSKFRAPSEPTFFAVAVADLIERVPRLGEIYLQQRAEVAGRGRLINLLGAERACRDQVARAAIRLASVGRYSADRYVRRLPLEQRIDEFHGSNERLLPVVGESGTGKTTALIGYLSRRPELSALFVSASRMKAADGSLADAIERELEDADAIVSLLRKEGTSPVLVLDGWNEAPKALLEGATSWIEDTVEWMDRYGVKLVLTSRPEHWQIYARHFPPLWLQGTAADADTYAVVGLGDFSADEAEEALRLYDLDHAGLSSDDIRHPLKARIYRQVHQRNPRAGLLELIEAFIDEKVAAVAERMAHEARPREVRDKLAAAVRQMLEHGTRQLTSAQFADIFPGRMGTELIREHVFEQLEESLRFTFDEVAEYLESERVDVDALADMQQLGGMFDDRLYAPNAVAFATLRLEAIEDLTAYARAVENLVALCSGEGEYAAAYSLVEVMRGCVDLEQIVPALMRLEVADYVASSVLLGAIQVARIGVTQRLALARRVLPPASSFGWRRRDWYMSRDEQIGVSDDFWRLADGALAEAPVQALEAMVEWLGDETSLADRDAKVADVAARVLYEWVDDYPDEICELLASTSADYAAILLSEVAENKSQRVLPALYAWADSADQSKQRIAASLLAHIPVGSPEVQAELIAAASRLQSSPDERPARTALHYLSGLVATRDEAVPKLLRLLEGIGFGEGEYQLAPCLQYDWELVLDALERSARHPVEALQGIVQTSWEAPRAFDQRVVKILASQLTSPVEYELARVVESLLWRRADVGFARELIELAEQVVRDGTESARRCIAYFATSPAAEAAEQTRAHLFDLLIQVEGRAGNADVLIQRGLECEARSDATRRVDVVRRILTFCDRAFPSDPQYLLLSALVHHELALDVLRSNWPPEAAVPSDFAAVNRAVEQGRAAHDALLDQLDRRHGAD